MSEYPTESKEGMYQVVYQADGKKLIVLEGLSAEDTIEPSYLQGVLHSQYVFMEGFYWILLLCVFVYMAGLHVVIPLLRKFNIF